MHFASLTVVAPRVFSFFFLIAAVFFLGVVTGISFGEENVCFECFRWEWRCWWRGSFITSARAVSVPFACPSAGAREGLCPRAFCFVGAPQLILAIVQHHFCPKFTNFGGMFPEFQQFFRNYQNLLDSQSSSDFATKIAEFSENGFRRKLERS